MKKPIFYVILAAVLLAAVVKTTWDVRKSVESKQIEEKAVADSIQKEKKAINDSIILLNQLWIQENQRYVGVIMALDSISRKGGTLPFTDKKGKLFEITLIPKK